MPFYGISVVTRKYRYNVNIADEVAIFPGVPGSASRSHSGITRIDRRKRPTAWPNKPHLAKFVTLPGKIATGTQKGDTHRCHVFTLFFGSPKRRRVCPNPNFSAIFASRSVSRIRNCPLPAPSKAANQSRRFRPASLVINVISNNMPQSLTGILYPDKMCFALTHRLLGQPDDSLGKLPTMLWNTQNSPRKFEC